MGRVARFPLEKIHQTKVLETVLQGCPIYHAE